MTGRRGTQVVVAGADVFGLVTALGLARAGVEVEVLDTGPPPSLARSAVHHWSVLPGLADLGVLDDLVAAGFVTHDWCLKVLRTGERIAFDLRDLAPHLFNLHVEDAALRGVLERHLAESGRVHVRRGVNVRSLTQDDDGVTLTTEDGAEQHRLRADWVVASDGSASAVRRALGLGMPGSTWRQRCVLAMVDHDFAAHGYASDTWQVDDQHGAVVQRAAGTRWRYTYVEPITLPEEEVGPRVVQVLAAAVGEARARVLDWTTERMHERSAERYSLGRAVLIADAAHVTNRMTGHSSISAYFDAYAVVEALVEVVGGRAPAGLVEQRARERRQVFLDRAAPWSTDRINLISQIDDLDRLEAELSHYREASADPVAHRDLLQQSLELRSTALPAAAAPF